MVIRTLRTLLPRDHVPRVSDRLVDDLDLDEDDWVLLCDLQRGLKLRLSRDAVRHVGTVQDLVDVMWQAAQTTR